MDWNWPQAVTSVFAMVCGAWVFVTILKKF